MTEAVEKDKLTMHADLRIIFELGEQLISKDEVALAELVKNSYDADAEEVKVKISSKNIIVSDNGAGMNIQDIQGGWLRIGTGTKRTRPLTPKGRRVLGEKGIGRLAAFKLGSRIELETRKEGGHTIRLRMEFPAGFSPDGERTDEKPLDVENFVVSLFDDDSLLVFPKNAPHGTTITVSELKEVWDEKRIGKVRDFLSRIVPPLDVQNSTFSIWLETSEGVEKLQPPRLFNNPPYRLEVVVQENGRYAGTLKFNTTGSPKEKTVEGDLSEHKEIRWSVVKSGGPGSFRFELSAYDLDTNEIRGSRRNLSSISGISLIKNNFPVILPGVDWLGLNLRRVNNPTMRLSTNQVIGAIFVDSSHNPNIIEKTDRQGLLENVSFEILKSSVDALMRVLELERVRIRKGKRLSKGSVLQRLDAAPLKAIARSLPAEEKAQLLDYASGVTEIRAELEDLLLGRDRMATLGLLSARLVHEGRNALARLIDNASLIESDTGESIEEMRIWAGRMTESVKILNTLFQSLDPLLRFRKAHVENVDMRRISDVLSMLYEPDLRKGGIHLEFIIDPMVEFKANPTDLYVVLANLFDNAVYWVKKSDGGKRVIEVRTANLEGKAVEINVEDSGPGISESQKDIIFEPGISFKDPPGTGLGLAIVKDIIESYKGEITAKESQKHKGARFVIVLPLAPGGKKE